VRLSSGGLAESAAAVLRAAATRSGAASGEDGEVRSAGRDERSV
jgi:hypothetical protein